MDRYSVDSSDFNAQHISIIKNYSMAMYVCVCLFVCWILAAHLYVDSCVKCLFNVGRA